MTETFDVAIIGAGMAGSSLAAECAPHARVLLIEAEDTPGYHTTGRSAAFWEEAYGGPGVYPLTAASGTFLSDAGYLAPRGAMTIGRESDRGRIEGIVARFAALGVDIRVIGQAEIARPVPRVRADWVAGPWAPNWRDLDVGGLHASYPAASLRP